MFEVDVEGTKYKVDFLHLRSFVGTACFVSCNGKDKSAMSYCHPRDNFNKNTGRKIALQRAIADFPREQRKLFWDAYWKARGKVN